MTLEARTVDETVDAFLEGWKDVPTEPSEHPEEEKPNEPKQPEVEEPESEDEDLEDSEGDTDEVSEDEEDTEDVPEDDSEDSEDDAEEEANEDNIAPDDAIIRYEVDGETLELSVSDAKRLAGQEAAINKKAELLATERKATEAAKERAEASMNLMLEQAEERFRPYAEIDWVLASKRLDEDELQALRQEAQAAHADYTKVKEGLDEFMGEKRQALIEEQNETVKNTQKILEDPTTGIPGFGPEMYKELIEYAVSQGYSQESAANFITPEIFKLLHKASQFDKGKQVATVKRKKTPSKTISTKKTTPPSANAKKAKAEAAKARMRERGGDRDSTVEAFLAGWEINE